MTEYRPGYQHSIKGNVHQFYIHETVSSSGIWFTLSFFHVSILVAAFVQFNYVTDRSKMATSGDLTLIDILGANMGFVRLNHQFYPSSVQYLFICTYIYLL